MFENKVPIFPFLTVNDFVLIRTIKTYQVALEAISDNWKLLDMFFSLLTRPFPSTTLILPSLLKN